MPWPPFSFIVSRCFCSLLQFPTTTTYNRRHAHICSTTHSSSLPFPYKYIQISTQSHNRQLTVQGAAGRRVGCHQGTRPRPSQPVQTHTHARSTSLSPSHPLCCVWCESTRTRPSKPRHGVCGELILRTWPGAGATQAAHYAGARRPRHGQQCPRRLR